MKKIFNVGIDVGSTTVKIVVLDKDKVIFKKYTRHFSDVKKAVKEVLIEVYENRDDLFFDDEAERKEYLTELFSEIVTRYIENVKYENGLTDVTPIDFILKDK